MTAYPDLLIWWSGTITAGILFLTLVSVVLYYTSRKNRDDGAVNMIGRVVRAVKDFAFVWVLLTLLSLYIVSIDGGNYVLFAAGNIAVELAIFAYLVLVKKQ